MTRFYLTALAGDDPLKLEALKSMKATEESFPAINDTCSKDHCTYHEVRQLIGDDAIAVSCPAKKRITDLIRLVTNA
jgi:hypothetical protein